MNEKSALSPSELEAAMVRADARDHADMAEAAAAQGKFLQPAIKGYRQLSDAEVALMNEGKALAEQCGEYIAKLRVLDGRNAGAPGEHKPSMKLDQRWISIGATDLQRGFMAVIRGIAQPTTF